MTAVAAPKSRFLNWLEGTALIAVLQGIPFAANCSMMLLLFGDRLVSSGRGLAIFVLLATLAHALLTPLMSGPRGWKIFEKSYEPVFFDDSLSLADKIATWRVQPRSARQLMRTVILMSLLVIAVLFVSLG
jgi:hypothetical protein